MIQKELQEAVAAGEEPDPYDSPDYQKFVEEMAQHCKCEPHSARPCDGVLAGGLCDRMDWTERDDFKDGSEEEPFGVI